MVEAAVAVLAVISLTVLGAHLADRTFGRLRLPDIPLLLGLGWLLGPFAGLISPADFQSVLPLLAVVAIAVVVLDGALLVSTRETGRLLVEGTGLSLGVFTGTLVLVATLVHLFLGMDPRLGVLLGAMVGGAGIVIVIPLVRTLSVSERAIGIVAVEAVVADLFVVVAVSVLADAYGTSTTGDLSAVDWLLGTALAVAIGIIAALLWAALTWHREGSEHEYVGTVALLIGVHALTEHLHGVGIVAVLLFGLVIGRLPIGRRLRPRTTFSAAPPGPRDRLATVFRDEGRAHHDVVFLVRAFFFVGVGAVLDWSAFRGPDLFLAGVLAAAGVALGRILVTLTVLRMPRWSRRDRDAVALMFPLGLVAAVTSVIPLAEGVPGSERLPAIVAVALLLTNLFAALGVWVFRRGGEPVQPPS